MSVTNASRLLPIVLLPVKVQGEGAAEEIARAIKLVNEHALAPVMIVGRGGGSLEDLWAFNEEVVARAIFDSQVPVISAVGHEVDFTIADLVADLRAPTPSAAAEAVTPDQYEIMQWLDQMQKRLERLSQQHLRQLNEKLLLNAKRLKSPQQSLREKGSRIEELKQRLASSLSSQLRFAQQRIVSTRHALASQNPAVQIHNRQEQTQHLYQRLVQSLQQGLQKQQHRLQLSAQTLHTTSPLATLGRGYAIAFDDQQRIIKNPTQVRSGDALTVKVEKGDIACRVE